MTVPHPRPTQLRVEVTRQPVAGRCPECHAEELHAYPVLSEEGWIDAVKCARCLCSASRTPGPRLGPITLLSDTIPRGRAA
jgi:hypothetical protein